jgi:hypothetical protein
VTVRSIVVCQCVVAKSVYRPHHNSPEPGQADARPGKTLFEMRSTIKNGLDQIRPCSVSAKSAL